MRFCYNQGRTRPGLHGCIALKSAWFFVALWFGRLNHVFHCFNGDWTLSEGGIAQYHIKAMQIFYRCIVRLQLGE